MYLCQIYCTRQKSFSYRIIAILVILALPDIPLKYLGNLIFAKNITILLDHQRCMYQLTRLLNVFANKYGYDLINYVGVIK